MSKDRYSGDHEIEIVGGTNTLTVDANISVVGDATVGDDLTVTDAITSATLTTSGNVSVGGTLGVTGATTLSSTLAVTGAVTITGNLNRSVAASVKYVFAGASFTVISGSPTYNANGDYIRDSVGGSVIGVHSLEVIPNGCTITDLRVRYNPGASSGYSVTASIRKRSKASITGTTSEVAAATDTSGTSGVVNVATTSSIDEPVSTSNDTYFLLLDFTAPAASDIDVFDVEVECDVTAYS